MQSRWVVHVLCGACAAVAIAAFPTLTASAGPEAVHGVIVS